VDNRRCNPNPEHGQTFEESRAEPLIEEQFNKELHNDLEAMLSQEPCDEEDNERQREEGEAERRAGESAGGDEEDDDGDEDNNDEDEEEGYQTRGSFPM
jgi:hypothetical protein